SLSSDSTPANVGQTVNFTVTVPTSGDTPATGSVEFLDGTTVLGTVELTPSDDGTFAQATLPMDTLAIGDHPITISYVGDDNFSETTSDVLEQTIVGSPTTTTLTSSSDPLVFGQATTFTVTVGTPDSGVASGDVLFVLDGQVVSTATLDASGTATWTTTLP